jgi:hypothetical protein
MGKKTLRILLLAVALMGAFGLTGCDPENPCEDTDMGCTDDGTQPPPEPGCENTTTGCQQPT